MLRNLFSLYVHFSGLLIKYKCQDIDEYVNDFVPFIFIWHISIAYLQKDS